MTATVVDGSAERRTPVEGLIDAGCPPVTRHRSPRSAAGASDRPLARAEPRDAPYCYQCGNAMQRAGSCYVCGSCGTTSGCS